MNKLIDTELVDEAIDDSERHRLVREDLAPFTEGLVSGDQQGAPLARPTIAQVAGRGHDLRYGPKACGRRIGPGDPRQREQVFSGGSGHRVLLGGSVLRACLPH